MSSIVRMTAIASGLALAAGAGYWGAHLRNVVNPGQPIGISQVQADGTVPAEGAHKILYYRNPMGLPDTSPVPKKDSMGMDYIPVYADDKPDDGGSVVVSPARIQTLGVKTAEVALRAVDSAVRASGRVEIDERTQVVVAPRFEGWIERLHVNAVGDPVTKGQSLFTAYSPELQSTGEELRIAERLALLSAAHDPVASESARLLAEATRARLRNLEVAGQSGARQVFHAPVSGVVLEKTAVQGGRFMPGDALFRIVDLSKVWIIADVYEQDLARVRPGQVAQVTLDAYPGRDFTARVGFLYPMLDASTRSTRVRLELDNPDGLLRPGMFAQVALTAGEVSRKVTVPVSAIIDDGERQVVLLALGEGRFKPQPVQLGERGRDVVEVRAGVVAGDRVVVSANFLIDSESKLKAALSNLTEAERSPAEARSAQDHANARTHRAEGSVDAIDVASSSVTITHGAVTSLNWPAMSMEFSVADPKLLKGLVPGLPVRFDFAEHAPGEYVISRIERSSAAQAPAGGGHGSH